MLSLRERGKKEGETTFTVRDTNEVANAAKCIDINEKLTSSKNA